MPKREFSCKSFSSLVKLTVCILPIALIVLLPAGLKTSAMVGDESVSDVVRFELSGHGEEATSDRAVVRRGTVLTNGRIEGSLWQLTGASTVITNGTITSDLLLPGTPQLQINTNAFVTGTTITGPGSLQPSRYSVMLNGGTILRNLITRVDTVPLTPVAPPPQPSGTRSVSISNSNQNIGDPATLRNLTVSGNPGAVTIPPGTYGSFSLSGSGVLVFGDAWATEPGIYNLQSLSMSGRTRVEIAGPVVLTIGGNFGLSGSASLGSAADPELLKIRTSGGNIQLSEATAIYGRVYAPSALVNISGNGFVDGMLVCDRLNMSGGVIRISLPNAAPVVSAGEDRTIGRPYEEAMLYGTVTDDGFPAGILGWIWSKAAGPGEVIFADAEELETTVMFSASGTYVLRLTASDGELVSYDEVTITVGTNINPPVNLAPIVNAGGNQTVTFPAEAQLNGEAKDDGLPSNILIINWSKTSGPGTVTFGNPNSAITTASFNAAGVYVLRLTASDGELSSYDEVTITVNPENMPDLPPDPASIAPPLDPTIATTLADATRFLYTGDNPIQRGMDEDTINDAHVAILKGYVLDRNGNALPGVTVTVWNRSEFGYTLTRADGGYDLVVNGGGSLVVNYEKPGYLPVHRRTATPWQDFVLLPDVRMIGLDPLVTKIDLNDTSGIQVAQSSVESDDDGERRVTMLFTPGTTATMTLPDGTKQALTELNVRATEYTVGPYGTEMMPETLPPQVAYTYAAEFSVNEALAVGSLRVEFSQPVITYVDNRSDRAVHSTIGIV